MNYCKYCGSKIELTDNFCSNCGKRVQKSNNYNYENSDNENNDIDYALKKNTTYKICCILAYLGSFFWLPLLFFPNEKNTKYYSNQGFWIFIISFIAYWSVHIIELINGLLSGTFLGVIIGGIYSLLFTLFLIFMFYLFIKCIKSIRDIHNYKKPVTILFFEEKAIIK